MKKCSRREHLLPLNHFFVFEVHGRKKVMVAVVTAQIEETRVEVSWYYLVGGTIFGKERFECILARVRKECQGPIFAIHDRLLTDNSSDEDYRF